MSLRLRLFIMLGGLILLLLLAQWWWIASLMRGLDDEVDEVALEVGSSVFEAVAPAGIHIERLVTTEEACAGGEPCPTKVVARVHRRRVVTGGKGDDVIGEDEIDEIAARMLAKHRRPAVDNDVWLRPDPNHGTHSSPDSGTRASGSISYSFSIAHGDCSPEDEACHTVEAAGADDSIFFPGSEHELVARHLVLWVSDDEEPDTVIDWRGASPPADSSGAHQREVIALAANSPSTGGVRFIPIPDAGVKARVGRFSRHLLLGTSALLLAGLVAAAVVAQRVSAPLRQLSDAAERVGSGALGTRVGAVSSDRDVGRALGAFNRMSEQLADLDQANRNLAARQHLGEIGDIARGLAHTLRNPLNALGLSLEELAARAAPGDDTEHLATGARRQIRRLDHSIRSFLALASQGGAVEPVDPGALAHDVALEVLQDAGGRVRFDVAVGESVQPLTAVAAELRAVVQALVVNAAEASPDGGTVDIEVRHHDPQGVCLVVSDRGSGLAESVRARLFTPHQTTKAHGSGMGLFLARRIATTRYGGDLALEDRAGGGTRATLVLLPRREEREAAMHPDSSGDV